MPYDADELISTARRRLKQAEDADGHNRKESEIDLLFRALEQWDESVLTDRQHADPPRPALVVDRLTAFSNQVTNEIRQAKPSPHVSPRSDGTKETAKVIEGKVRAILYDSDSDLAFTEAAKYAVASSTGHFRLDPEMVDESTNQQRLCVNPVWDPATVYTDPFHKKPDGSDARWRLVVNIISRIEFKERWPNAEAVSMDFFAKEQGIQGWMDPNNDKESVMIAEYWCVVPLDSPDYVTLGADEKEWADGKQYEPRELLKKKKGEKYRVFCHFIDGHQELEPPVERPGEVIPIFTVEGDSFWVKGKRYVMSLIRGARDNQRLYNWEATKEVEILAMQATSPYLVTPAMVANHEAEWKNAPNQNYFYLKYNPGPDGGRPERTQHDSQIQAISLAKAQTAQEMKDGIGLQDPNLGRAQRANQSGIAIHQLRSEGDMATFHYQDNLARTLKTFCKTLVHWLPYYHDVEEDMIIMGEDMQTSTVTVNSPQPIVDRETGKKYQHDLTQGDYECIVDIGPSAATAREEQAKFYGDIISAVPDAFWVLGDLLIRSSDFAGSDEAADRIKRAIAIKTPGLIQDDQNAVPPAAQAQIAQLQAQAAQMGQALQEMTQIIKTKGVEAQGRIKVEQIKSDTAVATGAMAAHAKITGDQLKHKHDMYDTTLSETLAAAKHALDLFHESELAPGPDGSQQGLHPTAIPPPNPGGGPPNS